MFKFAMGALFVLALLHPAATKDFLSATVDVAHSVSTVAVTEAARVAEDQTSKIAAKE